MKEVFQSLHTKVSLLEYKNVKVKDYLDKMRILVVSIKRNNGT